jgi:hypothetical protein
MKIARSPINLRRCSSPFLFLSVFLSGSRVDRAVDPIFRIEARVAGSIASELSSSWYPIDNRSRFEWMARQVARSAQGTEAPVITRRYRRALIRRDEIINLGLGYIILRNPATRRGSQL